MSRAQLETACVTPVNSLATKVFELTAYGVGTYRVEVERAGKMIHRKELELYGAEISVDTPVSLFKLKAFGGS